MVITSDDVTLCIEDYRRQYEAAAHQLQELEQNYQQQKQQLQTALAMSAGAVAAFEHLLQVKIEEHKPIHDATTQTEKDDYGG